MGFVAEIPSGALADRFSRRGALVASGLLQALGYVLWITLPSFGAFAAGFVLWGLGGALASGSLEALTYEGLSALGEEARYPALQARITSIGLLSEIPNAFAATTLFSLGGYRLAGWVSIGCCIGAAALAARLPEVRPTKGTEFGPAGYLATLRSGIGEVSAQPAVRAAVLALAVVAGLDGLEEYFPLQAAGWGIATAAIPIAMLGMPIAGAAGAALGSRAGRLNPRAMGAIFGIALVLFGATGFVDHPAGLAGISAFYFLYHVVLVALEVRLQESIRGPARATVTSVAGLGIELSSILFFGLWALGGVRIAASVALISALLLPRWLRSARELASRSPG